MKKLMMIALAACAAAVTGCKSIEVERRGQTVATYTDTNGVVHAVCDAKGNPVILDGGWLVDYFQHGNWQKFDEMVARAGSASLSINKYESGMDSNVVSLVHTSLAGATKLIVAAGEAYVKVAGGGAQAETALSAGQKIFSYFTEKGGDVSKAKVTSNAKAKTVTVTDGTTCIVCDAAGNCTDYSCTDGASTDTGTQASSCSGSSCTDK